MAVAPGSHAPAAAVANVADSRSAVQQAADSGAPVEVLQKRTEDSKTLANPDGTFTLEQSAVPVRKKKDGQWVDLDPTLARGQDGLIRPKATAVDMVFSSGGTGPLVVLDSDDRKLKLTWPTALPTPTVQSDSLTYPSVYPGVDLRISVTKESFSEVLIVHTRQAAQLPELQQVQLALDAPGLQMRRTAGGTVEAVDNFGEAVFSAPKPAMWDSSGDGDLQPPSADRTEEPLEGDSVATMPVAVTQNSLTVTPVRSLIDDPATVYPLHVDPPFTGVRVARSMINEHYPTTSSWGWGGDEGVGYQSYEPWSRKRLLFGFSVGQIAGADVQSAVFSAYETWSASCTPKVVEVWKVAKFTDATTWSNGSGSGIWKQKLSYATAAHGRDGCDPGGYWVPFAVPTAVDEVVSAHGSTVYLGMRASSETDELAWKRFRYDVKLSVTYNYPPTIVDPHTKDPYTACVTTSASDPVIGDNTPIPVVSIVDPDTTDDGQHVWADFEMRRAVDQSPFFTYTTAAKKGGSGIYFEPPPEAVAHQPLWSNTTYVWRARAHDGVTTSPWSTGCLFYVDTTKPLAPIITVEPVASSYPMNQPVTIRLSPNGETDLTRYGYAINDDAPGPNSLSLSAASFTTTPSAFGTWSVSAWSYDQAGNQSAQRTTVLRVQGTDPVGRWPMDEGSGVFTADEGSGKHGMNLSPQATWEEGNHGASEGDHSVYLHGLQTSGDTTATAASNIIDTSQNFTVAARVKLDIKSNRQVIVSEDQPGRSSFALGTSEMTWTGRDGSEPEDQSDRWVKWNFTVSTSNGPVTAETDFVNYRAGDWAHVVGVFDRSTRDLKIYVNGIQQQKKEGGTALSTKIPVRTSVVDGTGPFRTGFGIDNSAVNYWFRGLVEDVNIYDGLIGDDAIQALALGNN
ncbi:LamG domain-containing protein [Kribbella voronezhensis]|uniref:LamG domain-containing protein n=1 Tax=Kribbella voronezhensis TaxID=2512212 RepID=UPI0014170211|nr:LamG domain-containing protein [Kribbella voronezhensis]